MRNRSGARPAKCSPRSAACRYGRARARRQRCSIPSAALLEIVKCTCVDDCGVIINPLLVMGQVHGGVAQGLGQAVLEHTVYDTRTGRFLAGVKGIGEVGACGSPPAIVSAG